MLSTFPGREVTLSASEPRYHLQPGAAWLLPGLPAPATAAATAPAAPPLDIPACPFRFSLALNFPADYRQVEVLVCPSRRVAVCCTRQWGKSTLAAIKALHHGLVHPGSLVLIASRTKRQAGELLRKVLDFAQTLGLPVPRAHGHSDSLLLPNHSRIIALPGKPDSIRCFSAVSLLIVDEAAFVPDSLYHALRPMIATAPQATVWLLSTPNGQKGFFYHEWTSADPVWSRFTVPANECPRISDAFLAEERRLHGPAAFNREYMCEFGSSGDSFFEMEGYEAAAAEPHSLAGLPYAGHPSARWYVGFDLGQRSSPSAMVVIERLEITTTVRDPVTFAFVKENHFQLKKIERFPLHMTYDDTARKLKNLIETLGYKRDVTLLVDATGVGQPFLDILRKHALGVHMMAIAITSGGRLTFSSGIQRVPKRDLLRAANYLLTAECFRIPPGQSGYQLLKEEMEAYRIRTSASGNERFATSTTDDLVMAFSLAAWQARKFLPVQGSRA